MIHVQHCFALHVKFRQYYIKKKEKKKFSNDCHCKVTQTSPKVQHSKKKLLDE